MDASARDAWSREWGARYGRAFLEDLARGSAAGACARLMGLGEEPGRTLDAASWQRFGAGFLDFCLASRAAFAPSLAVADPSAWMDHAARLLEADLAQGRPVDLRDELTVSHLLGLMGKRLVFGVYHGAPTRLPRRVSLRLAWRYRLRYLRLAWRAGLAPAVLEIHLPKLANRRFTEELNAESHLQIARFLRANPAVGGVFNANWFYDPAVARISPHLAFLPRFGASHGALLAVLGPDADAIADATVKGGARRAKWEAGEYRPTRVAQFWPRDAVLAWAAGMAGP